MSGIPPDLCLDCGPYGEYTHACINLHIYYLAGALCTIIGSSFVIFSYLCDGNLRQHPSILIFMRCVFDLLFGILFVSLYFTPIDHLTCDHHACNRIGPLMMFLFLCSNGYFAASIADLYISISNPFSSPHKLTNKMHAAVIILCFTITIIIRFALNPHKRSFAYRPDIQFCWVTPVSEKGVNPINLAFIFGPILLIVAAAFAVNIYAFLRLRKGLPDTFAIRMRSVQDSFSYSVGFTLYFIPLGICYFCIWNQDRTAADPEQEFRTNNNFHVTFALLLGCLGINDFTLWYCRKFRKRKTKQMKEDQMRKMAELETIAEDVELEELQDRQRKKTKQKQRSTIMARPDLKQVLVPERPVNLYRAKTVTEESGQSQSNGIIRRMFSDISVKPNTKGNTINKALRREVLAYTTDGIAQSIDRAKKLCEKTGFKAILENFEPRRKDYPSTMHDEHGATMQRFGIYIQYNCQLLYTNNNSHIVSDTQLISLRHCFGSHADTNQTVAVKQIPVPVPRVDRATTKYVFSQQAYDSHILGSQLMGKKRQFVDYAPLIFRFIRVKLLSMRDEEYLNSIIPSTKEQQKKVLDAKFGDGKSGAFFYFTHDSRFLVKTIKKAELELFIDILPDYVRHLINNPNTILSRCVGLHSLRMYGLTMYYLVMENVFLAQLQPHEKYDLKGSWVGRGTDFRLQSGKLMKDNDLKRFVILNKKNQKQILCQLDRDTKFLEAHELMDYSLLLGIYHMKICTQHKKGMAHQRSFVDGSETEDDEEGKYDFDNGFRLAHFSGMEQTVNTYAGGVQAQVIEGPGIYYMGIIDYLQQYSFKKKLETLLKTYVQRKDGDGISCVEPTKYRKRFMNYMENIIINDHGYFRKLEINNTELEKQSVYVYPPKDVIDDNMATLRKKKFSAWGDEQSHQTSPDSAAEKNVLMEEDENIDTDAVLDTAGLAVLNATLRIKKIDI